MNKLLSGRWLLTVIGGMVFAYAVLNDVLPAEATTAILTAIFMSYFQRTDRKGEGNG